MKSGCGDQEVQKSKAKRSIPLPVLGAVTAGSNDIKHSKTSRWRARALIVLNLLMVAHVVQWLIMGRTISPIEPSESMYTLQNGAVNAGFIFFTLAILATLIFGRFVCGWGCHILALQDLCAWMMKKMGLTPRPFRSRLLIFVPLIAALYMFVWPTVFRIFFSPEPGTLMPGFTNHLITINFWQTFPSFAVTVPFFFICGFMTVYFLGSKGFCTYGCPYGGFFNLADKVAPGKIRVTDACNQCGHCTATCTSNVLVHAEVKQYGMVVDSGCMKCMDCISVCPNDALYFGFGKPAVGVPKTIEKNYSLTWPEEIFGAFVFFASLLAVWDVYQLVPMLMALGIAGVTTFLFLRSIKLLRSDGLAFYGYSLKSGGKIQAAGLIFLGFAFIWIGLTVHSGWVRYNERSAGVAFQNLQIPEELALARPDPGQFLSPTDRANIANGKKYFREASAAGFFTNSDALSKAAWLEYLSGDTERAIQLLGDAATKQPAQGRALSLYYRGAMLNRLRRYDEAMASLDQALAERPDLILAREELGESLWLSGRKQEAIQTWSDAVRNNGRLVIANIMLAGAAASSGRPEIAAEFEKQADQYTPSDPLFHWMVGMRLQNIGMEALAGKQFQKAIELDPRFKARLSNQ